MKTKFNLIKSILGGKNFSILFEEVVEKFPKFKSLSYSHLVSLLEGGWYEGVTGIQVLTQNQTSLDEVEEFLSSFLG